MATSNDLKNGMVLLIDGQLWSVIEFQHVKPGKGPAFVRTKLKNVKSDKVVDKTFNAGVKVDTATVDRRDMQYLYNDGRGYVFMDNTTYDQMSLDAAVVGDVANFLLENQIATVAIHDGSPLYVELPPSVVLEITYTEPGLQGDRSTGGTKPATLETGHQIQVPLFIENNTKVKVDTRTRSKSRKRALDALYAAELNKLDAMELLSNAQTAAEGRQNQDAIFDYAETLVRGVTSELSELDARLQNLAEGWKLERMPNLDRALLRMGAWEILHNAEVPNEVAISEAVNLASEFSTDDSPKFINGVLARLAKGSEAI
ncbi:MAG: elongation factor P [Actinobacteria bacterium]|nr:elongation factor P [Actinomycetota bacterium]